MKITFKNLDTYELRDLCTMLRKNGIEAGDIETKLIAADKKNQHPWDYSKPHDSWSVTFTADSLHAVKRTPFYDERLSKVNNFKATRKYWYRCCYNWIVGFYKKGPTYAQEPMVCPKCRTEFMRVNVNEMLVYLELCEQLNMDPTEGLVITEK